MNIRGGLAVAILVASLGTLAGCGTHGDDQATPKASATDPAAGASNDVAASGPAVVTPFPSDPFGSPVAPLSPVAGIVTAIVPAGSAAPTRFTLKSTSGVTIDFLIGQIDDLSDFPLSDLSDDIDSQVGLLVYFKQQGSDLVVYHLENAP